MDWLRSMDQYFDWYDMNDARRIRFAKMKLTGQAQLYWDSVELGIERLSRPPIYTWVEMKEKLREADFPLNYNNWFLDELNTLPSG